MMKVMMIVLMVVLLIVLIVIRKRRWCHGCRGRHKRGG
jgi:hypothetical protein